MTPEEDATQIALLVHSLWGFEHTVDPTRHSDARLRHLPCIVARLDPFEVHTPCASVVLPSTFSNTIVAGQRVGVGAHICGTLHVAVAAENVGTAAAHAHIAQGQLQNTGGAHHGVTNGVLGLTHTPHDGAWAAFVQHLGHFEDLLFLDAAGLFNSSRRPLRHDIGLDLVHAIHTVIDVLFIFPTVLEDVIEHTKQEGNI